MVSRPTDRRQTQDAESVPFLDLRPQNDAVVADIQDAWKRILEVGSFVLGDDVDAFERMYAEFCGVRHCIGVGNGTDALEFALRAVGVRPGHECVLPANTFVATAEAVARIGAVPILVDCDPDTLLMDIRAAREAITEGTGAVIPVHLYGQMVPMEELHTSCEALGVPIVEDAAQSHGATRHGVTSGGWGRASATSFYPGKNLGAFGDGGAVTTSSDEIARSLRMLGNHGSLMKYRHETLGFNSRLDAIQAAVLAAKLPRLTQWNQEREQIASRYRTAFIETDGVRMPSVLPGNTHVWHLFVVLVADRQRVFERLNEVGISVGVHYPYPIHLSGAFESLGYGQGSFPNSEAAAQQVMSLPIYPGLPVVAQERVIDAVLAAVQ